MKMRNLYLLLASGFLPAICFMAPLLRVASAADGVDVIVNKSNAIGGLSLANAQ